MPANMEQLHPRLRDAWAEISREYQRDTPGRWLIVTCTYRSPEAQQKLYARGRTAPGQIVTYIDGKTKRSNHNYLPARALDFAVVIGGKISWDPEDYDVVGALARAHGLVWGGDWKTFKDRPHIELP